MSDYYIRFDENGQPYIEHGLKDTFSSVRREGAKYLEKIKTKAGGTRYFYTPEELKAYYNQGKTKVTNAAKNVRAKASDVYNKGRAAVTNAGSKVKSTAKNVAEKGRSAVSAANRNARDFGTRTASALKNHGSETLKDITGKSKHERYEEAWDRTSKAKDNLANNPNSAHAQREVDEAEAAEAKAHEEYLKSPLGRVNDAKSRAKELADSAKEKAGSVKDKAKEKAGQAGNKAKELVDSAKDKAKGAVDKAKDKLGFDERDRAEKAWDKYDETDSDEDWDEANRLQDEFNKTPIGKLNSFWERTKENVPTADYIIDKAKEKAGTVKDKAKEKVGQVGDKAKELAGSAKEKAEEVAGKAKEKVSQAADKVADQATKAADAIRKAGGSVKEQLEGMGLGLKVHGNKVELPSGKEITIPETILTENIITENYIYETIIPETMLTENGKYKK